MENNALICDSVSFCFAVLTAKDLRKDGVFALLYLSAYIKPNFHVKILKPEGDQR